MQQEPCVGESGERLVDPTLLVDVGTANRDRRSFMGDEPGGRGRFVAA